MHNFVFSKYFNSIPINASIAILHAPITNETIDYLINVSLTKTLPTLDRKYKHERNILKYKHFYLQRWTWAGWKHV